MTRVLTPVWEWLDRPGLEVAKFSLSADFNRMDGIVVTNLNDLPIRLRYQVLLGPDWSVREAILQMECGTAVRELVLTHNQACWSDK